MELTSAAVVPHAPLLLEGMGGPDAARAALRAAAASVVVDGDVAVLLSPHGTRAGVYATAAGSLAPAGVPDRRVEAVTDGALAERLARAWGAPLVDDRLDHEAVVALSLLDPRVPVVVACLSEITARDGAQGPQAIEEGKAFATALRELEGGRATLIASAHTGAALAESGPLGRRWSALELEEQVRRAIETDPARLTSLAFDLWLESGSCSSGVLAALGELAPGPGVVRAYDASMGVGYLVAEFAPS